MTDREHKEIIKEMTDLEFEQDIEEAHKRADELLCQALILAGYTELVERYRKVGKWYS